MQKQLHRYLRRPFRTLAMAALCACAGSAFGQAAAPYPTKPIRVIVASAPGGLVDMTTRLVLQTAGEQMGQSFVIENRPGDPVLGIRAVKSAPTDGYTLLATSNSITSLPFVKRDVGYDLEKDLIGIGQMIRSPWFMIVGPNQTDRSVAEFVERGRRDPASVSFASGGVGTAPFLAAESFLQKANLRLLHVPYKGNGAAMPDLVAGRVTMMFEATGSGGPKVKGGQIRALAVSSTRRLPGFPDVPTLSEVGYPNDFSSYVWVGLFAPTGTPRHIVDKLNAGIQRAVATPEIRKRYELDGGEAVSLTPDEMAAAIKSEMLAMEKLVTGLKLAKE